MTVRTISIRSVADVLHHASYLVVLGVLLVSLPRALAQQYPPPAYPGPAPPPTYPVRGTPVRGNRRLTPVPDTAGQPVRHRRYSRKRSRHRPGPRWCGHRAIGAGPAVGCGCRAAMPPDPMLMLFGFPVSGAPDTAAGFGSRDIGVGSVRRSLTGIAAIGSARAWWRDDRAPPDSEF